MPRPRRLRRIGFAPCVAYFKPAGIRLVGLEKLVLTLDEFEAVKLKDFLELDQEECARRMNISQPTFHRLIQSARKKIADAMVNGKAIKITGGSIEMKNDPEKQFHCVSCGHEWISDEKASICPRCRSAKVHSHASCLKGKHQD